jgi:DNA integrity scanning protein DisA with diadenylate cyclase activity
VNAEVLRQILTDVPWCPEQALRSTLALALEIAAEAREGRRTGALFVLGDSDWVLAQSRALILDPLAGHVPEATHLDDPRLQGTVKALALLDGAFIVALDGTVVGACRYLDVPAEDIDLPLGLGSRHVAAAAITRHGRAVAVVASHSGVVRVFAHGRLVTGILAPSAR